MMTSRHTAHLLLLSLVISLPAARGEEPGKRESRDKAVPASPIRGFRLQDPRDNRIVDFADLKSKKCIAVVFVGTECPISNAFVPVLAGLHRDYASQGVQFLAINSNRQDTPARVLEHARRAEMPFPVLVDPGNKVADQFGARRTPEAFLLLPSGKVVYQGRIDDQFGIGYKRAGKPTRRDLAEAIDETLASKAVSVASTPVAGCLIGRAPQSKTEGRISYAKHVSRILQKNCQECHRPGQVGPMSLLSYDDAVSWAETIQEVVTENRMPPWYADPRYGKWVNDRRLSKEDRETLLTWLSQGTPRGDDKDLPPPRAFTKGWQIGEPDVIFKMPKAYDVPAETPKGGVPYRYFSVPTGFTEDRWIERAEARPGAPEVVHHIVAFIAPPGEASPRDLIHLDSPGSVLVGFAPGDIPMLLEPGRAKKIPAGWRIVFQMHYTPNGRAQSDISEVGLIFAKQPPRERVFTLPIHNRWFMTRWIHIPAGAENFEMEAEHAFKEDVRVTDFMPHMHLRGKDFRFQAIYPDGKKETLLSVPAYNFNWQSGYRAEKPIRLPKGSKIHCLAHFDNSAKNPHNPDPRIPVFWGDQTWEEMMIGWIQYTVEIPKP
jgi:mono/diheme cytochrome c family protein